MENNTPLSAPESPGSEAQKVEPQQQLTPQAVAQSVYPSPTSEAGPDLSPVAQAAMHISNKRAAESNKRLSERVSALIIISVLLLFSSLILMFLGVSALSVGVSAYVYIAYGAGQFGSALYLLLGKDQNIAALILKIFLILQVFSVLFSIGNPRVLVPSFIMMLLLGYAHYKVKALPY